MTKLSDLRARLETMRQRAYLAESMTLPRDMAVDLVEDTLNLIEALRLALYYVEGDATWEGLKVKIKEFGIEVDT